MEAAFETSLNNLVFDHSNHQVSYMKVTLKLLVFRKIQVKSYIVHFIEN